MDSTSGYGPLGRDSTSLFRALGMKWLRQIEDAKHSGTLTQMQTITV